MELRNRNQQHRRRQVRGAKRRLRPRVLGTESLESRCMMSASPTFTIGSPFTDNTEVATASSESGMSVAVWTKHDSGGDTDILAQRYRADGSEVGGIITVANTSRKEHGASVAMDDEGNFVVAWTRDWTSTNRDIRALRFAADGTELHRL